MKEKGMIASKGVLQQGLERFDTTIVPPGQTTPTPLGSVYTAAAIDGLAKFPPLAKLLLELVSGIAGDGDGLVHATFSIQVTTDRGKTWTDVPDAANARFTSNGINDPMTSMVQLAEVQLAGAESFALRGLRTNNEASEVAATFDSPRVAWSYRQG
jgi:hypothetical protein